MYLQVRRQCLPSLCWHVVGRGWVCRRVLEGLSRCRGREPVVVVGPGPVAVGAVVIADLSTINIDRKKKRKEDILVSSGGNASRSCWRVVVVVPWRYGHRGA
jgi:hypothetical protein